MFNTTLKKLSAVAVAGAATIGSLGVAYGWWSTNGDGTGSGAATAGVEDQLVFTQEALTDMFPGDTAQDLVVNVKNNSSESVYIDQVNVWVETDKAGCDGDDFLINGVVASSDLANATAMGWTDTELAAGSSADTAGDTIQFNDKPTTNQDVCKGAVVTINYDVPNAA